MQIHYYKTTLPNGEVKKFTSYNFYKYNPYRDEMLMSLEQNAEYVRIDDDFYRVNWLKYEPKQTLGKYPKIVTQFITEEEYEEYRKEQEEQFRIKVEKEYEENQRLAQLHRES